MYILSLPLSLYIYKDKKKKISLPVKKEKTGRQGGAEKGMKMDWALEKKSQASPLPLLASNSSYKYYQTWKDILSLCCTCLCHCCMPPVPQEGRQENLGGDRWMRNGGWGMGVAWLGCSQALKKKAN